MPGHRKVVTWCRTGLCTLFAKRLLVLPVACWGLLCPGVARATILVAKNGMMFEGQLASIDSIAPNPLVVKPTEASQAKLIVVLDDGLRRTFLSRYQVQPDSVRESDPTRADHIVIKQNVARGNRRVESLAGIRSVGDFDQFGRRTFSISTPRDPVLDIVQGITEITPIYTRLEGLEGRPSIQWDCRIATSSIPRQVLSEVIRTQGVEQGVDARIHVVRLLFTADRYYDAWAELKQAIQEYPELAQEPRGAELLERLKQLSASRLVDEISLRREAGQHRRAEVLLQNFPSDGVAQETLLKVSDLQREMQATQEEQERLKALLEQLIDGLADAGQRQQLQVVREEFLQDLNPNSLLRLQDFQRLERDPQMLPESQLSLLVSGWLAGTGSATQNLMEAISMVRVRDLVTEYLRDASPERRTEILQLLGREEGATPTRVAQIMRGLRPPVIASPQPDRPPGNFALTTTISGLPDPIYYEVQLPDEYDPLRKYPTIVTLHGENYLPQNQIDWWAGSFDAASGMRLGQATRLGYIVIAPRWMRENQRRYEYTGREHAAVLASFRDASRRFSVDSDRVYLSGHSAGGDAAWDIALAHPDMWAGAIPIVAVADYGGDAPKYVSFYNKNARFVPLYFVMGELDGNRLELNRRDFDRYLKQSNTDAVLVEYRGRGHEHFYDEIHRLFEWMKLHRRDPAPKEFECATMRPFDNFFWYLEVQGLPPGSIATPLAWADISRVRPAMLEFRKNENNTLLVRSGAEQSWLWLHPDLISLSGRVVIDVNGNPRTYDLTPQVETLLEDARTRVDRVRPFWTRLELTTGKRRS